MKPLKKPIILVGPQASGKSYIAGAIANFFPRYLWISAKQLHQRIEQRDTSLHFLHESYDLLIVDECEPTDIFDFYNLLSTNAVETNYWRKETETIPQPMAMIFATQQRLPNSTTSTWENDLFTVVKCTYGREGLQTDPDIAKIEFSTLHPMVVEFANQMNNELRANEHKGDWLNWRDTKEMISELEWHKAKLLFALEDDNSKLIQEYLADCANILMFIGNARNVYKHQEKEPCKKEQ